MIGKINSVQQVLQPNQVQPASNAKKNTSFGEILKKSIDQVNTSQIESDKMTEALASGKSVELHDVMISSQKASITMLTAIEVRNKAIEAYQEMMRMQV
ncbi:flagellar hook-basal body complex protein FliE [Bacillus weihaiensis]|uniref:flagellar hook-basal body complex protein FliE n=1 Tax=Bacillus weihaiensis TaxID=1547283 RepID=UPI00235712E6|nr:flagellar hook-basal body complex protein FliE [Bacillus weihaiensis]